MRSIPARVAAAVAVVVTLAACSSPADSAHGGDTGGIPETPVITGEPEGYNADDVAFATDMISHHKQAIELSELVPDRTTDPELVELAGRIAVVQQPEINIMNVLLVQWKENPEADTGSSGGEDQGASGQAMSGAVDGATIEKLKSLRGNEFDVLWLESMIGLQEGAVAMANAEITDGANVDAVAMAKQVAATQGVEIDQMKQMLEGRRP